MNTVGLHVCPQQTPHGSRYYLLTLLKAPSKLPQALVSAQTAETSQPFSYKALHLPHTPIIIDEDYISSTIITLRLHPDDTIDILQNKRVHMLTRNIMDTESYQMIKEATFNQPDRKAKFFLQEDLRVPIVEQLGGHKEDHRFCRTSWITLKSLYSAAKTLPQLPYSWATFLYIRECYATAAKFLEQRSSQRHKHKNFPDNRYPSDKGVILFGQPGIGKSCFLTYLWLERMFSGQPTVLQLGTASNHCHVLFDEGPVRYIREGGKELEDPKIWLLCDSTPLGLAQIYAANNWFMVLASSPRRSNYKQMLKDLQVPLRYMNSWSMQELLSLRHPIERNYRDDVTLSTESADIEALLPLTSFLSLAKDFGHIPRVLFKTFSPYDSSFNLEVTRARYEAALLEKITNLLRTDVITMFTDSYSDTDSHPLISLAIPEDDPDLEEFGLGGAVQRVLISAFVGNAIGERCITYGNHNARQLYSFLLQHKHLRTSAGWVYDGRAHAFLSKSSSEPGSLLV